MMTLVHKTGFLLTRQSRDINQRIQVEYWLSTAEGPVRLLLENEYATFYLPLSEKDRALTLFRQHDLHGRLRTTSLQTFQHQPVLACCFSTLSAYHRAIEILHLHHLTIYEADLRFTDVCLMSRLITAGIRYTGKTQQRAGYQEVRVSSLEPTEVVPAFCIVSLDVECALDGTLYSVALLARMPDGRETHKIIMVGAPQITDLNIEWVATEVELLLALRSGYHHWLERRQLRLQTVITSGRVPSAPFVLGTRA